MTMSDNTLRYSMLIRWSDEDRVYIVEVPELPGCKTHGTTYQEAVTQAQDAIETWIYGHRAAGHPIPKPSVYSEWNRGVPLR